MSPPLQPGAAPLARVVEGARLDLNESAYPPLPAVAAVLRAGIPDTNRYPDFLPDRTRRHIAEHLGLPDEQITVGAGATGVAVSALQAVARRAAARGIAAPAMVTALPTFDGYPILAEMVGLRVDAVGLNADGGVDPAAMLAAITAETVVAVLCSPHNPTGSVIGERALRDFLDAVPRHVTVLLDQAYIEFCDSPPDLHRILGGRDNVLILRTFSKAYGLAALRVGYGIGGAVAADVRRFEVPFAVGPAAMAAVPVALAANNQLAERVASTRTERARMAALLEDIGAPVLPSQGNFLFLPGPDGIAIGRLLRSCGVATKECGMAGTRITIGDRSATDRVLASLRTTALTA
ncbi:aminotransferase class I/II-fold pyridoxal phosphate-dependent enzyme [Gordonia sp. CPCC 205515]|uniref:pyridoxal phosphate-dependent aminotransferase n=1 Tax=Gordonia sp. CPCC 205515 TaxID=3140791 RepID=UPI003AF3B3A4